jgi:hypothetical protein
MKTPITVATCPNDVNNYQSCLTDCDILFYVSTKYLPITEEVLDNLYFSLILGQRREDKVFDYVSPSELRTEPEYKDS